MSVTREDVLRIAQLAELTVAEETLPTLVDQMSNILAYVAQLSQVPAGETARPFIAGPDAIVPRPDEVRPWPLAFGPKQFAPAFRMLRCAQRGKKSPSVSRVLKRRSMYENISISSPPTAPPCTGQS